MKLVDDCGLEQCFLFCFLGTGDNIIIIFVIIVITTVMAIYQVYCNWL